ncbi:hypothetical protein BDQ17DRAFT_1435604 [Cyathus striatus]|nr:hypothetical protein BDQ17DRAFT_1435604 [Cyathus striatus]
MPAANYWQEDVECHCSKCKKNAQGYSYVARQSHKRHLKADRERLTSMATTQNMIEKSSLAGNESPSTGIQVDMAGGNGQDDWFIEQNEPAVRSSSRATSRASTPDLLPHLGPLSSPSSSPLHTPMSSPRSELPFALEYISTPLASPVPCSPTRRGFSPLLQSPLRSPTPEPRCSASVEHHSRSHSPANEPPIGEYLVPEEELVPAFSESPAI